MAAKRSRSADLRRTLDEIERGLKAAARGIDPAQVAVRQRYVRPILPMHGLTVPEQRAVFRAGYSFSAEPAARQYPVWDFIWRNARSHEGKLQPLFFLATLKRIPEPAELEAFWELARGWADGIHAWDMSDELSKTYSYLLEAAPALVYPQLARWNRDADAWKRRQSVVALFCYARLHRSHPPVRKVLPLIENLLADENHYVQKGVGWALRETYNVYPNEAHAFVLQHAREIRPEAFSTALEKMSAREKRAIKTRRNRRPRATRRRSESRR